MARTPAFALAAVLLATSVPAQESTTFEEPEAERPRPPASTAALSAPVDADVYVVGPGDRLTVTIWGTTVRTFDTMVSPEGELLIPGMAGVDVAGLTLQETKNLILDRLDEVYHDVEFSIVLAGLRRVRVSVLGAVEEPGAYETWVMTPASEVISRAGGLLEHASRRNIRVRRRSGRDARADLDRYENAGDTDADPPILDGDVVFVPAATAFVYAQGGVVRPGEYEYVDGEGLASLIDVAGGFTHDARPDSVELARFVDAATVERVIVPVSAGVELEPGDQVHVRRRPDWREAEWVEIEGEVRYPGSFGINEREDRLSDVIARAGGPTERAYFPNARIVRAPVPGERDLELRRLLDVPVGSMTETEYAYYKMRLRQHGRRVSVDFGRLISGDEAHDPLLVHGDVITIPEKPFTVTVSGQVVRPGKVAHEPGKRYRYYVDAAEGYAERAKRNRVRVIRASTGQWLGARRAGKIEAGDEIWVPEAPETDWWESVREVLSFLTSLATVYLVIDQATSS